MTKQILTSASGIYQILNTVNGKCYVGSAVSVRRRWLEHSRALRRGAHHSQKLQRAWDKYSELAFKFQFLSQFFFLRICWRESNIGWAY